MKKSKNIIILVLFVLLILADRLTKILLSKSNFQAIHYVENSGFLFGLFRGYNYFFVLFSLIALGLLLYYFLKCKFKERLGLIIIGAGVVSNLIDRIFLGYNIDFIDLKVLPVFNLADVFIFFGVVYLLWRLLK